MSIQPTKCKWCGSIWHSKNKCEKREIDPFKPLYEPKRSKPPVKRQNASDRLRLAHKGKSERSQLIGYADKYFSAYIRAQSNVCYTCSRTFEELQCGHFMSRRYLNTRWDEINCHGQCNDCNVLEGGNVKVYEQRLRAEYGGEKIDELKQLAQSGRKMTDAEIETIIEKYKRLVF